MRLAPEVLERLAVPPQMYETGDGRLIAYDVRGSPDGRPCFWFHGSPSCRLEAVLLDGLGRAHGVRFIAPDRPGIGRSTSHRGWSMRGFATDVVALADHLGFERFSVAGGSGGGPFVLAAAAVAFDRVDRALCLACAGAFELDAVRVHIGWVDRLATWAVAIPGVLPAYFGALAAVARAPEGLTETAGRVFKKWLPDNDPRLATLFARTLKEATRSGPAGIVEDTEVLHRPWGFSLSEIGVPVDYVNGTHDEFVPFAYGAELAERTPKARLHAAIGADHFETIFDLDRLRRLLM